MKVTLNYHEIQNFKRSWSCSGIPDLDSITFTYQLNGDLVDIEAMLDNKPIDSETFDGPALVALSQDAQNKGLDIS